MTNSVLAQPLGILGGTFDPIHFGHLRLAIELCEAVQLERVHIIPSYQSHYRATPLANPHARLTMIKAAIINQPRLIADEREIQRGGISYTIDSLTELRNEFPGTPLCLLLGIDAFLGLPSWKRSREILNYAHIIVAQRPNYQLPLAGAVNQLYATHGTHDYSALHTQLSGKILFCPITALDISATKIRTMIQGGRNPTYLLPDQVYQYILKHKIYNPD